MLLVRELAEHDRERALLPLVLAARNQACLLSELGQRRAALALAEEAVSGARQLYTIDRDHAEWLAQTLVTVANELLLSGRPQEALARSREAVDLTGAGSDAALARRTATLALSLTATGAHADALVFTEQALHMWRDVAAAEPVDPQALKEYGRTLYNYAVQLYRVGRWQEAALAGAESVAWYRTAADDDRPGRSANLMRALTSYAVMLAKVQRPDEAVQATAEAVTIGRELAATHSWCRPHLAAALKAYGPRLAVLGQVTQARAVAAESVSRYRELAATDRTTYLSELAESVHNHAALLDAEAGLAAAEEVVALRRELVGNNRGAELPGLALSLTNLAGGQAALDRLDAALVTGEEALRIIREAVAANRVAMMPRYAHLLQEQALRLDQAGRAVDAITLGTDAVAAAREALTTDRGAHLSLLCDALRAQAERLFNAPGRSKSRTRRAQAMIREADGLSAEHEADG